MSKVLTLSAVIMCPHGGTVILAAGRTKLTVDGTPTVTPLDMIGAPIVGCANVAAPAVPCTAIVTVLAGQSINLMVDAQPVLLDTATGLTNGVPPVPWLVQSAGQIKLDAM